MLARPTTTLLSRRMTAAAAAAPLALSHAHSIGCRRSLTQASGSGAGLRAPAMNTNAVALQKRHFLGQTLLSELTVHSTQLGGCLQLQTLLYSPLGTAMLLVLAYNVVVICTKHVNYSMEITAKDYVQDQQLYVIMRYGILSCILLGMEVMFVEV